MPLPKMSACNSPRNFRTTPHKKQDAIPRTRHVVRSGFQIASQIFFSASVNVLIVNCNFRALPRSMVLESYCKINVKFGSNLVSLTEGEFHHDQIHLPPHQRRELTSQRLNVFSIKLSVMVIGTFG